MHGDDVPNVNQDNKIEIQGVNIKQEESFNLSNGGDVELLDLNNNSDNNDLNFNYKQD